MDSTLSIGPGPSKAKKSVNATKPRAGHSGPTTFFLKTEKELEKGVPRGRRTSRRRPSVGAAVEISTDSMHSDSGFGVESLEDTISSTFASETDLARTTSNTSCRLEADQMELSQINKRKGGNRVHPSIIATGQRIISSDRSSSLASLLPTTSPTRTQSARRGSGSSLANMNQPLTPIRLSPHRESAAPSEPRSGSPKSFRLSDEECSLADETHSQAILSSRGDDEPQTLLPGDSPQLVMPSLSMPIRRPFTEVGRRMGRAKVLIIGPPRVGKTSFIRTLVRTCEHIVHVDQAPPSIPSQSSFASESSHYIPTSLLTEIQASTRPYPTWWTDFESRRMLHRRSSVGDGVLERNLTFIDSPGIGDDSQVRFILNHLKASLSRTARLESMNDDQLISLLSGEGGVQIDAVIYLFDPHLTTPNQAQLLGLTSAHQELLQYLSKWTNLIPVIGHADSVSPDMLCARRDQIRDGLDALKVETYPLAGPAIFTISSASEDDADEVDASILMSSQYLKPLVASDLGILVDKLLAPENVARMHHTSAIKFLLWRQQHLGHHIDLEKQGNLRSSPPGNFSSVTSTGSVSEDAGKVLVPHTTSSYYRSASPGLSDTSALSGHILDSSTLALAKYNEQTQTNVPFRQVRLAKWAQDLQRSLDNERRKYHDYYVSQQAEWSSSDQETDEYALVAMKGDHRPSQGRLGGDLRVIDPRDPLGLLAFGQAFRRRGFHVLQVAGSCGILGAMIYWVAKNWHEVQGFLGFDAPLPTMSSTAAVPAPDDTRPVLSSWIDDSNVRGFFSWRS